MSSVVPLNFDSLLAILNSVVATLSDPRKASNATRYTLRDAVIGAFGCFFMQSESFLDYQRQLNSRSGKDNAQSLFRLEQIPSVEQIRNILDLIAAPGLFGAFVSIYQSLKQQGYLQRFEILDGNLLVALDGTDYYSSQKVSCQCCSKRESRNGKVTYSHKALLPVIVAPSQSAVDSLPPAFIVSRWSSQYRTANKRQQSVG